MKVGIVNYNCGNVRSLFNAFIHLNANPFFINTSDDFNYATHIALPGVGSFSYCVNNLKESGLLNCLEENIFLHKKPILGICVGMQMLFESSEEGGLSQGLSWLPGKIKKLKKNETIKVPHVGWNVVNFSKSSGKFNSDLEYDFYFDHSFALKSSEFTFTSSTHSQTFVSSVRQDNILACQFHPEKSQTNGLNFLKIFLDQIDASYA